MSVSVLQRVIALIQGARLLCICGQKHRLLAGWAQVTHSCRTVRFLIYLILMVLLVAFHVEDVRLAAVDHFISRQESLVAEAALNLIYKPSRGTCSKGFG